jgi:hypothetical protein
MARPIKDIPYLGPSSGIHVFPGELAATYLLFSTSPVNPGDPIKLIWNLSSLKGTNIFPGTVSAVLYLDLYNAKLYESEDIVMVAAEFTNTTNDQTAIILPPIEPLSNQLYQIGNQTLRLEVTSKETGQVFVARGDLVVQGNQLISWDWSSAQGTVDTSNQSVTALPLTKRYDFIINHAYQLLGRISNASSNRNVTLMGSVAILETPFGSSTSTQLQTFVFSVGPGAHEDFESSSITKNWTWLIPGVWVQNPQQPLEKTFTYAVKIAYFDNYGNVYPDVITLNNLVIDVTVSDNKRYYADGALAALAAGLISGIFTFGVGTAVFGAVAAGLGVQALDPPIPDSRYREPVAVPEVNSKVAISDMRFADVIGFASAIRSVVDLVDALGDIQNRLLGARNAKDRAAIRLQRDTYLAAIKIYRRVVKKIAASAEIAVISVKKENAFDRTSVELTIRRWQRSGIPAGTREALHEQGCSLEILSAFEAALNDVTVTTLAQDFSQTISLLAYSVIASARLILKDVASVVGEA